MSILKSIFGNKKSEKETNEKGNIMGTIEYWVYKTKNPDATVTRKNGILHVDTRKWENHGKWIKFTNFEETINCELFDQVSDLIFPIWVLGDKYCPVCTRSSDEHMIEFIEKVPLCWCDICSDCNFRYRDWFFVIQYNDRPICIKFKSFPEDYDEDKLKQHVEDLFVNLVKKHKFLFQEKFENTIKEKGIEYVMFYSDDFSYRKSVELEETVELYFPDVRDAILSFSDKGKCCRGIAKNVFKRLPEEVRDDLKNKLTKPKEKQSVMPEKKDIDPPNMHNTLYGGPFEDISSLKKYTIVLDVVGLGTAVFEKIHYSKDFFNPRHFGERLIKLEKGQTTDKSIVDWIFATNPELGANKDIALGSSKNYVEYRDVWVKESMVEKIDEIDEQKVYKIDYIILEFEFGYSTTDQCVL